MALRLYVEAIRRGVKVYPFARNSIARAATHPDFGERLRSSPEAAEDFVRLLCHVPVAPLRAGSILRELHDVGLLEAMIPEFAPVVGRVQHDVYHVYTVDVHSVRAVDRLRELCRGELAVEHSLASRLAAEVARPRVLFAAMLLHDIGKDEGSRDHAERGVLLAQGILGRLGYSTSEVVAVQQLVRHHLRMYHISARRDVDDPQTLEEFVEVVHDHEGLLELYLLTVCDISTTSPTALTSWKAKMLEELYVATERQLSAGAVVATEERRSQLAAVKECARSLPPQLVEQFLTAMPERYLYANETEGCCGGTDATCARRQDGASASLRPTRLRCRGSSGATGHDHRHLGGGWAGGDQLTDLLLAWTG
jgi:[protein-PII] uridylyltransferase